VVRVPEFQQRNAHSSIGCYDGLTNQRAIAPAAPLSHDNNRGISKASRVDLPGSMAVSDAAAADML
jgi:hypothetical protein